MIAALYVESRGAYSELPSVDVWDWRRDARGYRGPYPVVAHPPCERWCSFAKGVEKTYGYPVGDDGGCFAAALKAVRTYGGVLEHPARSLAWNHFHLPIPRSTVGWTVDLFDGGASCYVEQGRYGHRARKATWLYAYGLATLPDLRWGRRLDSEAGELKWGSNLYKPASYRDRPRLTARELAATPPAFRDVLIHIAKGVRQTIAA